MATAVPSRGVRGEILGHHFDYRFRRLAVTLVFDAVGNTLMAIALAGTLFFSIPSGEARGRVLLYLLFTVAPFAIVATVLGPLLDRGMAIRRVAVIAVGLGRAFVVWMMATRTESFLLFPLALGVLVGQRLYTIARSSLVPACLPVDEPLVRANSFLARTAAVSGFVTAVAGVAIHKLFGAGGVLRVAAAVYLLMGVAGFLLPSAPSRPPRRSGGPVPAPPEEEKLDLERTYMLRPGVRAVSGLRALSGLLLFLLAFALRREGAGTAGFGGLLLGIGVGAFLASLAAPVLNRHIREDLLLFAALAASAVATLVAAKAYSHPTADVLAAVVGGAFGVGKLAFDSMAQRGLPRRVQGRLFARWETSFQLSWVAGAIVPVAVFLPVRPTLVVAGLVTAVGSVAYAVDAARSRHVAEQRLAASP